MDIKTKIKSQIFSNKNKMRVDKFITNALFSKFGYYSNNKPIRKKYDFITSPEISQMFGEIIGLYLYYVWQDKINSKFNLIELGPGNGTLLKDLANSCVNYPNFMEQAEISLIELNKELIKIQKENIKILNLKNLKWSKKINFRSNKPSIIYSNEFFDCFPVRQFLNRDNWYEKYVGYNVNSHTLYFKDVLVKNKKILSYLNLYKDQDHLEVSFERNKYFEKICKYIKNKGGIFLTIDYGYLNNPKYFTLQSVQNHKYSNVLENFGNQDISSHVNFGDFIKIAQDNTLDIDEFCSQREFLIKNGILERKEYLSKYSNPQLIQKDLDRLIGNKEMGKIFKCLIVSNL